MAKQLKSIISFLVIAAAVIPLLHHLPKAQALFPYSRPVCEPLNLGEDPFKFLEENHFLFSKGVEKNPELARADWKETSNEHVITLEVPGMKKEEMKIQVEENNVLSVSGEKKKEVAEVIVVLEVESWHRVERISGKFRRLFKLPVNADLEKIKANLDNGVLKIVVPKLPAEEKIKKQPKVIRIDQQRKDGGEEIFEAKND